MKKISIDETKLPAVMEIIEKAALLMDEKDCDSDKEAKKELGAYCEAKRPSLRSKTAAFRF